MESSRNQFGYYVRRVSSQKQTVQGPSLPRSCTASVRDLTPASDASTVEDPWTPDWRRSYALAARDWLAPDEADTMINYDGRLRQAVPR